MQNKLVFSTVFIALVASFFAGKYFEKSTKSAEYLDALTTTVNLAHDRWGEVHLLSALYEASLVNKESSKQQFVLAVALMYRDDTRIRDVFSNDHGLNTGTVSTNKAVIDFLTQYGYSSCAELTNSEMVQCNLDVVDNDA
ncbi:hypothetical protein DXV75_16910 [Alteromonas aestuariivivens]|uniref:Uncharacterized protein n=1 Tax=Alteromonas aestuariivivens TaxID=1938339 RepID=A0A3D8M2G4_9ALTE|nr:hypothetical protein [Alteromonas aestuariivivens]RDV23883.1 hypothetical protein DXV75_16910 [Alteromonas aestuariivivens]